MNGLKGNRSANRAFSKCFWGTEKLFPLICSENSGNSGNNVEIGSGTGALGQKWYVTNKGNNVITLKNGLGCMLDVTSGKNENCTNIEIWTENGKNPQDFMLKNAGNNQFGIVTSVSNGARGLDVANKGTADGSNVQQYDYYGGSNQLWVLEKTEGCRLNFGSKMTFCVSRQYLK